MTPEQERLVLDNLDLAGRVAQMTAARTRANYDDLYQDGCIGLIWSAERWDGVGNFRNYAYTRVQGAMLDGIRRMDIGVRRSNHPTGSIRVQPAIRLDRPVGDDSGATIGDLLADPATPIEDQVADDDFVTWALQQMTDLEHAVIAACLWGERTQSSIAGDMGVTPSWVSQVAHGAYRRVRAEMKDAA